MFCWDPVIGRPSILTVTFCSEGVPSVRLMNLSIDFTVVSEVVEKVVRVFASWRSVASCAVLRRSRALTFSVVASLLLLLVILLLDVVDDALDDPSSLSNINCASIIRSTNPSSLISSSFRYSIEFCTLPIWNVDAVEDDESVVVVHRRARIVSRSTNRSTNASVLLGDNCFWRRRFVTFSCSSCRSTFGIALFGIVASTSTLPLSSKSSSIAKDKNSSITESINSFSLLSILVCSSRNLVSAMVASSINFFALARRRCASERSASVSCGCWVVVVGVVVVVDVASVVDSVGDDGVEEEGGDGDARMEEDSSDADDDDISSSCSSTFLS